MKKGDNASKEKNFKVVNVRTDKVRLVVLPSMGASSASHIPETATSRKAAA